MERNLDLLFLLLSFGTLLVVIANTINIVNKSPSGEYVRLKVNSILFFLSFITCLIFAYMSFAMQFLFMAFGAVFLAITMGGTVILILRRMMTVKKTLRHRRHSPANIKINF